MYLESIDPGKNRRRFYSLDTATSLFGAIVLIRRWGRIGSRRPQERRSEYREIEPLLRDIRRMLRRRHLHGYKLRRNHLSIVLPGPFLVAEGGRMLQLIARQTPEGIFVEAG